MRNQSLDHFVETDRVHEEAPEDTIHSGIRDARIGEGQSVDTIARNRILMFWLQNYTWDVQMLGISQSLVKPGFEDFIIQR
jgi:hypothetical protein